MKRPPQARHAQPDCIHVRHMERHTGWQRCTRCGTVWELDKYGFTVTNLGKA